MSSACYRISCMDLNVLAHLSLDDIFKSSLKYISIEISLEFVPKGLIDNRSTPVPVMAQRRTSDKHLLESVLTQLTDAYMRD